MKLIWNLEQYQDNIALQEDCGSSITYQQLFERGEWLAKKLSKRSLVFLFCKNEIGAVLGYTAFLNHDIVPILLKHDLEETLQENLISTYQPEYVWLDKEKAEKEFSDWEEVCQWQDWKLMKNKKEKSCRLNSQLALLLTTSGSTGSPKLVRQSYENILANTTSIVQYLELDETERPITTLPMNYTYGLSIINSHLFVGSTILLTDRTLMDREFWKFLKEQQATSFGGVPYTYEILKKLRFFQMELPSLRTMTQAGGKLAPELHKAFAEYAVQRGKHFVVMYGQTEATARMAYLPYQKSLEKYGSMGIAIPGGSFTLRDVNGDMITKPDIVGELVYHGKNVTLGYAECRNDLAKGDERHGVLVTGDMAKMDLDGYFYIVGRKKRFLKIFGNRVNLDEIERMIQQEFTRMECACAGEDDKMRVYITDDSKIKDVRAFLVKKTKFHPSAFHVIWTKFIPKNEAGKILYAKLSEIIQGDCF